MPNRIINHRQELIEYFENKCNIGSDQLELMNKISDQWLNKCAQSIKIAERRGYPLKIDLTGLLNKKPVPGINFIHTHVLPNKNQKYKHIIEIEIKI